MVFLPSFTIFSGMLVSCVVEVEVEVEIQRNQIHIHIVMLSTIFTPLLPIEEDGSDDGMIILTSKSDELTNDGIERDS